MVEDLPVELWLYILSFLPRGTIRKLFGVNRLLFELALDDIYEEIRFIADDLEMHKTFQQLKHKGIARRVRHLYIRPAFFPSAEEGPDAIVETAPPHHHDHKLHYFRKWFSRRTKTTIIAPRGFPPHGILQKATEAIANCPSLRELTIVLHDHAIPLSFGPFLTTLWRTIGSNLQRLDLELTPAKIPFVFEVLKSSEPSVNLPNLEELNLSLAITRFAGTKTALSKAVVADLLPLMGLLRPTLRSFNLVSPGSLDLSPLFAKLDKFPRLTGFALAAPFSTATVSNQASFVGFLRLHADTLKSFSIKPHTPYTGFAYSDASYETWLIPSSQNISNRGPDNSFHSLRFPELERLELSCKFRTFSHQLQTALDVSKVGSSCLTEAVLTDLMMPVEQHLETLTRLASIASETLRTLVFGVDYLRPEIVDFMADKFRKLKTLELEYTHVTDRSMPIQLGHRDNGSAWKINFTTEMSRKKYRHWNIKYLRCGIWRDSCKAYHPDMGIAMTVGQTFPEMPEIDSSYKCFCY